MELSDFVVANEGFQTSVNIALDFGSEERIKSLIPTSSVCHFVEEILKDVIAPSSQRAKLLVGPYGTGKSHIVLAALSAMWFKQKQTFERLIDGYKKHDMAFGDSFQHFVDSEQKLLPVIITGASTDLQHSLLYSLRNALKFAGLEDLMPQTNYQGALKVIGRWKKHYPKTLKRLEEMTGLTAASIETRLVNMDTAIYHRFIKLYPELTSGSSFDMLEGVGVIDIFDEVLSALDDIGISGIYVVYDEFSKYLESNIKMASVEDTKLLQDFAERCNRSGMSKQLHLLLISHKSISNYIDSNLPKERVDGWRGVSGRFRELEIHNSTNQFYELIADAIIKHDAEWNSWLYSNSSSNKKRLEKIRRRYLRSGFLDSSNDSLVVYGAYPLHPVSAFLLPELSAKIAQNERTMFTYLCSEEETAFIQALKSDTLFVAPDSVYDYFEPLMNREYYASPVHKIYALSQIVLRKLPKNSLSSKLIKTISLIEIVAKYETIEPTRQTICDIYCDCGYCKEEVDETLTNLMQLESVVYLRESNEFLKIKEASGIPIAQRIEDRADSLKNKLTACQIINNTCRSKAIYPSRHNEESQIVRYFDCGFTTFNKLEENPRGERLVEGQGVGFIAAVMLDSPNQLQGLECLARNYSQDTALSIVVVPKVYTDITSTLFKYAAAEELKTEALDDSVLAEEYEIVIEDYEEIIGEFVSDYFSPEKNASNYYAKGKRKNNVTRRRKLSDLLSSMCDEAFPLTPLVANEALNKNRPTGTALHSRTKILTGLCALNLEANLGFLGNGQETSMMRSALERTGIIKDLENPSIDITNAEKGTKYALKTIEEFVSSANQTPFSVIYDALMGAKLGIGMKKGLVPLFLALILRDHRNEIIITKDGKEQPFCAEVLDDIDADPSKYEVSIIDWTPEKASYLNSLGCIFGCDVGASRAQVSEAMHRWYVMLPQVVRNTHEVHTLPTIDARQFAAHLAFFETLKKFDLSSNDLIFGELPKIFSKTTSSGGILKSVQAEKNFCDRYVTSALKKLSMDVKPIFNSNAPEDASLDSVLKDWVDCLSEEAKSYVYSGVSNNIFSAIKDSTPDEISTIARIAKAATSLRIEDWNDYLFSKFLDLVSSAKNEIEAKNTGNSTQINTNKLRISFFDADGNEQCKNFDSVDYSPRAKMLKRSIVACVADMGGSVTSSEKRQVVFDVLKELC